MTERLPWYAGPACLLLLAASSAAQEPYRGKPFLGASTRPVAVPAGANVDANAAAEVRAISVLSSEDRCGLRVGDLIYGVDAVRWPEPKQANYRNLFYENGLAPRVGQAHTLHVLRPADGNTWQRMQIRLELAPYPRTAAEPGGTPTNAQLRPDLVNQPPAYEALARKEVTAAGFDANFADLRRRLDESEQFPDPDRLAIVRYVHRDAFRLEAVTREATAPLLKSPAGPAGLPEVLRGARRTLCRFGGPDVRDGEPNLPAPPIGGTIEQHLDYVQAVLAEAASANAKALRALDANDIRFAAAAREDMFDAFVEYKMLSYDPLPQRQRASVRVMDLAGRADRDALFAQAVIASRLIDPCYVQSLRDAAVKAGKLDAVWIARRNTPFGPIVVCGSADNEHRGDYAVCYDLGGDDLYLNNQGASVPGKIPTAVLVDCDGNDCYEAADSLRQGAGDFGVGILADLAGDDRYLGRRLAQGAAFAGVGVLLDAAGRDEYVAIELSQGAAAWGCGMLLDSAGDDRYHGLLSCQGVGLPAGLGMLADAGPEADRYFCKGKQSSGYGTTNIFEGWGQGCGVGFRPYASGGVGVLVDRGGDNLFDAGNFSQGCGYYYGFGVLHAAGKGNDRYIGSHYGQGIGCHQASGALIDEGGNDLYHSRTGHTAHAFTWDEATALLIDAAGDDVYEAGGNACGSSAMNGWSIFLDRGGRDTYRTGSPARAGPNFYHGGSSLSLFIDEGGDEDTYNRRHNGHRLAEPADSIFLDLPIRPD